jgi:hypothetical protein
MAQLLSNFGKQGVRLGLLTKKADIEDTEFLSKYFVIAEFTSVFTAGRNPVAFNGSAFLKDSSEVQVECLDSAGNSLFIEQAKATDSQFSDVSKFVVSVHVYDEIYNGAGKLILVGTTKKNETVRWIGNITIDKTISNASKVRFYTSPMLEVRPLLYPVVDTTLAKDEYPPSLPRAASATAIITTFVVNIILDDGGIGYTSTPTVNFSRGTATATAIIDTTTQKVVSITLLTGGSGYSSTPTISIDGGGGTGAKATAVLSSKVSTVKVTDAGSGYTLVPDVTFLGVGAGARATATLNSNGGVASVTVNAGGSGYTTAPQVTFTAPQEASTPDLNVTASLTCNFSAYAVEPKKDTNRFSIDKKRVTVDYRLVASGLDATFLEPSINPTGSFNSQMEGKSIALNITKIQTPLSTKEQAVNISQTFTIKKVVDSKTIILSDAFYHQVGKDYLITNVVQGNCQVNYNFVKYNTNPESNLTYQPSPNVTPVIVKKSYAEVVYRNLKTFSGFVARHKLYAKSLFHPGDFQLISDEPLKAVELFTDQVTLNKAYDQIGKFYHQLHIDKYWFSNSSNLTLIAQSSPINAMKIAGSNGSSGVNGNDYVIAKVDTIAGRNDNIYYPYDSGEYNRLSGSSYNSNFIGLKKDSLYVFTANVIMEKEQNDPASVSFYFTSSIASIRKEVNFDPSYGLWLGTVATEDKTNKKFFSQPQTIYFTPTTDYYGTLVIVPYQCNAILTDVSLKVYGDHGFSPDLLFINIPFDINLKNEMFDLKAELFDINSNLIISDLKTTQTFDLLGESLTGATTTGNVIGISSINETGGSGAKLGVAVSADLTVQHDLYLSNMDVIEEGDPTRFVGWYVPQGGKTKSGKLCYTKVSKLLIDAGDYISLSTVENDAETTVRALAIKYSGASDIGRRIFVDTNSVKTNWP